MAVNFKKVFMLSISLIIMFTVVASNFVFATTDSFLGVADITPIEIEYNSDSGQLHMKDGEMFIFDDSLDLELKNLRIYYSKNPGETMPGNFIALERRAYKDLDIGITSIKMFFTKQFESWIKRQTEGVLPIDLDLSIKAELRLCDDGQDYHKQVDIAKINIRASEVQDGSEDDLLDKEVASYTTRRPSLAKVVILSSNNIR